MKISTKGEYALICMTYLAKHYKEDKFISIADIAKDNNLSLKYLEKIIGILKKGDLFITERGNLGGYKLKRKPEEYTLYEIVKLAEGRVSSLKCVESGGCHKGKCVVFDIWNDMFKIELDYLKNKTLRDYI
ncbi:MAG: Rrf2 family transcriptional regulator [Bacilli bacterium]|nr:Rrf2 family transcriptional regulator [Bacilli bacterium]